MKRILSRIDRRPSSWLTLLLVAAAGYLLIASQTGASFDRLLMPLRFQVVDRPATGQVVIVEMDAKSAAAIARWPWSRSNYAAVVDRLRIAGAASIVFDVEFSSRSDPAGDRAFAAALARADGLVALPTFGQAAGSRDRRTIDALPIAMLRDHVSLASVSIRPDPDGQVRDMTMATVTAGQPRPSLSAFIAARSGMVDQEFPIDMSINPAGIPRLSFVSVRDGRFDPSIVKGRHVLIGATALEMGDRYGTPQWGVIPGVIVQGLAAETLLRGVPSHGSRSLIGLFAVLIVWGMVSCRSATGSGVVAVLGLCALGAGVLIAQHRFLITYPIAAAPVMIVLAAVACLVRDVLGRFRRQRAFDEATGLPNARALLGLRSSGDTLNLAVAHIGNYDPLRAVLGEVTAADVVIRVSERLSLISESNSVYRTSDPQLAFLLSPDHAIDDALHGLRTIMLQQVEAGGRRVDVAMTIGVATGARSDLARLLADASLAAENARTSDMFWKRAETDNAGLERAISLMGELDTALVNGEIEVFYQPKYNLREHRISSVEALVRWQHPTRGFVGPDSFIPIAEKTNRIAPLTLHVLSHVLRDLATLRVEDPTITAAVNISAKLLSSPSFNADVERMITVAKTPASALVFEVTESAAMADVTTAVAALRRYCELGIAVSMDDYGTGQSTLSYLRQLPLSELKIDRSFVQFAHQNEDDGILVKSTIDLAHKLGLKVVAEGVEDAACFEFLAQYNCDMIQGYLISRPVPFESIMAILVDHYYYAA